VKISAKFNGGSATEQVVEVQNESRPATETSASPAARNLALAHYLARLIDQGLIGDYTAAARLLGVSQPRLTHLMGLLLLAPVLQEQILLGTLAPGDKLLRRLTRIADWRDQIAALSTR
jgi:hypothetical protein